MKKEPTNDTLILEVDGTSYRWSENRLGRKTYTTAEVKRKQSDLEDYLRRRNATGDDYTPVLVDGVETRLYTAGKKPTEEQLEQHRNRIRENVEAVRIENVFNDAGKVCGVRAVYYKELCNTPRAKMLDMMEHRREGYLTAAPHHDPAVLLAEFEYLEALVEMLFDYKTYPELIKVDPRNYGKLGEYTWDGGILNARNIAAMWAIDKVYRLDSSLDMMRGCGLGTLSNWLNVPYTMLIDYIKHFYILR